MTNDDKIPDYITFPKTFENYRWYKPIIVFILSSIIMLILQLILVGSSYATLGVEFIKDIFGGGINALNNPTGIFLTDLIIIIFIPALYITSKIVKDRPFSSYSSSRGGWNFKLYLKALIIPLILYIIYELIDTYINGANGTFQFSLPIFIVILISIPLQCIAEEYMFRGLIMQTLGSWFNIPVLALIIQAIIFAMVHGYNSMGTIEMVVFGIIYGFFAWKTNGIEVSSAIHTANNLSLGLFVTFGHYTSTSSPSLASVASVIVFEIILFIIMYYVGEKTDWFGEVPENAQNIELFSNE
ncbi:CPBP family intramembrane glutamic endopeptidase [Methanobrevibacter sp.]|uniref:CPBP family intramembrane glutamic endopeptidase n=1 Tax=Methanobrevibacter sp. TaxID=66852 RepID=UPI00388E143F